MTDLPRLGAIQPLRAGSPSAWLTAIEPYVEVTRSAVSSSELEAWEAELGWRLPEPVRSLLSELGEVDVVGDDEHPDGVVYLLGPRSSRAVFAGNYRAALDEVAGPVPDRFWAPLVHAALEVRPLISSGDVREPLIAVGADGLWEVHIGGGVVSRVAGDATELLREGLDRLVI